MNDRRIGPDIYRGRNSRKNIADKVQTAYLRRNILLLQSVLKCDQVYRFSFIEQLHHGIEHDPVLFLIKIIRNHDLRRRDDRIPVH